jgi:hypothetical protein
MRDVRQSTAGAASSEAMRLYCCCRTFLSGCLSSPATEQPMLGAPNKKPPEGGLSIALLVVLIGQAKRSDGALCLRR